MSRTITFTDEEIRTLIDAVNVAGMSPVLVPGMRTPGMFARLMVKLERGDDATCANPEHGPHCCKRAA